MQTDARSLLPLVGMLLLAGCAWLPLPPAVGAAEGEFVARLGAPTGRYAMPGGVQRLEFATGPMGQATWMVDVGADGRSTRVEQVLRENYLAGFQLRANGMDRDAVLRELGRPGDRLAVGRPGHEVWSWRFDTPECFWWQVEFDAAGRVLGSGKAIDHFCLNFDKPKID